MAENIYQKLAKIRKLVEALKKNKEGHNYRYVTEDEILAHVTGGMEKHNLSLIPGIQHETTVVTPYRYEKTKATKDGKIYEEKINEILVHADMTWTWVNNEKPDEKVVTPWILVGQQQNASMAFGSGLSYAVRYFLLKYFNVSTVEDDVDAWKAKQRAAEKSEELEGVKIILAEIDGMVKEFKEMGGDEKEDRETLKNAFKGIIRKADGKPSPNFYDIETVEMAEKVREKISGMVAERKNHQQNSSEVENGGE